ncbi:MAG: hypothetical protein PVF93_01515 [Chromatiaceae bacterium]|jgi:hypothetical protein
MNKAGTLVFWLTTLCVFLTSSVATTSDGWGDYLVTKQAVEVLEGPDHRFPARTSLEEGRLVVELDRLRGFVQVRIPDKLHLSGWIRARDLRLVRTWSDAAGYPEGHPAASDFEYDVPAEGQPKPGQPKPESSNAVLWGVLIAAVIGIAVVLVLVRRTRLRMYYERIRSGSGRGLIQMRASFCRRFCGAEIEKAPEDRW